MNKAETLILSTCFFAYILFSALFLVKPGLCYVKSYYVNPFIKCFLARNLIFVFFFQFEDIFLRSECILRTNSRNSDCLLFLMPYIPLGKIKQCKRKHTESEFLLLILSILFPWAKLTYFSHNCTVFQSMYSMAVNLLH